MFNLNSVVSFVDCHHPSFSTHMPWPHMRPTYKSVTQPDKCCIAWSGSSQVTKHKQAADHSRAGCASTSAFTWTATPHVQAKPRVRSRRKPRLLRAKQQPSSAPAIAGFPLWELQHAPARNSPIQLISSCLYSIGVYIVCRYSIGVYIVCRYSIAPGV